VLCQRLAYYTCSGMLGHHISSQIRGFGEVGLSGHGRLSTLPWSFGSLFGSRRAADAIVFPPAGRGGEGVEEDGTTVFLVRVIYGLFLDATVAA
jgi:hypothetical protein